MKKTPDSRPASETASKESPAIYHIAMSNGQEPIELSLSPDEASRIIHSHRKVRYGKHALSNLLPTFPGRSVSCQQMCGLYYGVQAPVLNQS